uniref:Uncharacterized protein n=1 Tax=Arundo donax TaxID=35708 RepID=A0A0A9BFK0_ARUDO
MKKGRPFWSVSLDRRTQM